MLVNYAPRTNAPPSAASPVVTGPLAATTVTNSLGIFSLASLEPGEYVACAETTTPGLLDPCHWASAAPQQHWLELRSRAQLTILWCRPSEVSPGI